MKQLIADIIRQKVSDSGSEVFRTPVLGFTDSKNELFSRFKVLIGENHLMPQDLLPGAKTVMAFFLPFSRKVIEKNRPGSLASRNWAVTYDMTNKLIDAICQEVHQALESRGVKSAWLLPTYEFDKNRLVAQWSHKHVAFACGLGTFGKNRLLITSKGCAGRFGTMVLDEEIEVSPGPEEIHRCLAESDCKYCEKHCPAGAIKENLFDRHNCYAQCLKNDSLHPDLKSVEVCGKCATGPCAYFD